MLKVNGKYYPSGKRYSVILDVDSIYDMDIPIVKSSELIMSAIHLQLKIPYREIQRFDVSEICPIINQSSVDVIISKVNDPLFEKHLRNGLNLVGTSNWEDAGNRLGVSLEYLIKRTLPPNAKLNGKETLGKLITLLKNNSLISEQEFELLLEANDKRIVSSHCDELSPSREDYQRLFDAISLIVHKLF